MSFFTEIKNIVLLFEDEASVRHFSETEAEEESQNYDSFPIVEMTEDFSENKTILNGRINTAGTYNFIFKDVDSWENRQEENDSGQTEETSFEIFERMSKLADSVFYRFHTTPGSININPVNLKINWTIRPYLRKGINTFTGCLVRVNFAYYSEFSCL